MIVADKKPHHRTQHRFMVGFWDADLRALDELAGLLEPDRPNPSRSNALRVAVREALAARQNRQKSGHTP